MANFSQSKKLITLRYQKEVWCILDRISPDISSNINKTFVQCVEGDVYIGKYPGLNVVQNASGFIGSLSRLHVWNRVLPGEEIEEMAIRPSNYVGNVIDWYKLAAYVAGDVEVMKPSSALHTGWFNHKNCYILLVSL